MPKDTHVKPSRKKKIESKKELVVSGIMGSFVFINLIIELFASFYAVKALISSNFVSRLSDFYIIINKTVELSMPAGIYIALFPVLFIIFNIYYYSRYGVNFMMLILDLVVQILNPITVGVIIFGFTLVGNYFGVL